MFVQTWNKYLPIIKILMKRSVNGDQILEMNSTDFQRAAGGRKVKFSFSIELVKGRMKNILAPAPLARDLITALQQDEVIHDMLRKQEYELIMSSSFKLQIKNCSPAPEVIGEPAIEAETENEVDANAGEEVTVEETKTIED